MKEIKELFFWLSNCKRYANGQWRKVRSEELRSMYRSFNIVRGIKSMRLRWAGHVPRMEEGRTAFKILKGKPTGKRPLGRPKRRSKDVKKIGINARNWVDWTQDGDYWRVLVIAILNLRVS